MYASVELVAARETLILPARNISLGGIYLAADGHDLRALREGSEVEVHLFDALNERTRPVRLAATVVRHDGAGMALMWADTDADAAASLAKLLTSLQLKK